MSLDAGITSTARGPDRSLRRVTYVVGLRECPPGTGHIFLRHGERNRRVLPRRHPGVVSVRTSCAPERAYGTLPTWRSRWHWLNIVVLLAATERRQVLVEHGVSIESFRAWARAESLYAELSTGRRCIVRPDTVASLLEVSTRTVQRCRAAARDLGLVVDVVHGRMLSAAECFQARYQGSPQRGMANESALTVPAWLGLAAWPGNTGSVDTVTPTSGRAQSAKNPADTYGLPRGASGKPAAPSARRHQTQTLDGIPDLDWLQNRLCEAAATALAAELVVRVPFLTHESPKRITPTLRRFVRGALPWTATDVLAHIAATDRARQQPAFTADRITTRPAVVLAGYLRGVDPQDDHPRTHVLAELDMVDHSPTRRPWCGHCDERTRHVDLADGRTARCGRCHPTAVGRW
ncbi:hypothetical protein [Solicola sp. PLA-1-18]|uniref:hypothetical protein n=1 Tax=Solicola sp. PLA-1-18 TaxID=3380532 RepID=UPI003B7BD1EF